MALNNKAASINVGNSVPVSTRQSISSLDVNAPIVNEIEYRQTGVSLNITPQISSKGLILMDIEQEVSATITNSVGNDGTSSLGQSFEQRKLNTSVAVHSGDTLVLGGLIREEDTIDKSRVPLLSHIPIVGNPLFTHKSKSKTRKELLVLLTPRIIENRTIATNITNEFSSRMKNLRRALGNKATEQE
jgi:general secretion pathway protein D